MLCGYLKFQRIIGFNFKNILEKRKLIMVFLEKIRIKVIGFNYFKNLNNPQFPRKNQDFLVDYFIISGYL
jgi:hypothetical protein